MIVVIVVALIVGIAFLLLGRYARHHGQPLTEWPSYTVSVISLVVAILALARGFSDTSSNSTVSTGSTAPEPTASTAPSTTATDAPMTTPTTTSPQTSASPTQTEFFLADY